VWLPAFPPRRDCASRDAGGHITRGGVNVCWVPDHLSFPL
jgi:hypothetical protein